MLTAMLAVVKRNREAGKQRKYRRLCGARVRRGARRGVSRWLALCPLPRSPCSRIRCADALTYVR
jgi:hypothetical protein